MSDENLTVDEALSLVAPAQKNNSDPDSSEPDTADPEGQPESEEDGQAIDAPESEPADPEDDAIEDDDESEEAVEEEQRESEELFEIEHLGEKYQVPLALKDQFLMQSDYTKGKQELAEERKGMKSEFDRIASAYAEAIDTVLSSISTQGEVEQLQTQLRAAIEDGDEFEALKIKDKIHDLNERERALKAESDKMKRYQQQQFVDTFKELREQQNVVLSDKLPGWKDGKIQEGITKYMASEGYTPDELNYLLDSRVVMMAYKAMKYDRMNQSKPDIAKKIAPKVKTIRPSARNGTEAINKTNEQKLSRRLSQTGDIEDALALMKVKGI